MSRIGERAFLEVELIEAKELEQEEAAEGFFCVISAGRQTHKTPAIGGTLSPKWQPKFIIEVSRVDKLKFAIWQQNTFGRDIFIGQATIRKGGPSFLLSESQTYTICLSQRKGRKDLVSGEIFLKIKSSKSAPPEKNLKQNLPEEEVNQLKEKAQKSLSSKKLNFGASHLTRCPKFLKESSTEWTHFNFSFNFFGLYPDFSAFVNLQYLNLSFNHLSAIPSHVGALTLLKELYLFGNHISFIPSDIGCLVSLEKLDLSYNELSTIPIEIGKLTKLNEINLTKNLLKVLPKEIGDLSNLEIFDMSCCKLSHLPSEITKLSRLSDLNLGNNQIEVLPAAMGSLTNLNFLNLSHNQLIYLPSSLSNCQKLKLFHVDSNPFKDKGIFESSQQGTQELLEFIKKQTEIPEVNNVLRSSSDISVVTVSSPVLSPKRISSSSNLAASPTVSPDNSRRSFSKTQNGHSLVKVYHSPEKCLFCNTAGKSMYECSG